jgi:hypothetical protein
MLRRSLLLILFIFTYSSLFPYKNVKVVLVANKDNQKDSLGYNIVSGLAQWTYDKLKEGKIKMWATPYKSEEMSFNTLQGMEISSKINFTDCQNIFLYEIWSSDKKMTSFVLTGISFSAENKNGELVSFGFIDYSSVEEMLKKEFIPVNENGYYKTTYNQVLMNKSFDYEMVYFKDRPIQSPYSKDPEGDYKNGVKIKNKAFNVNKLNVNYIPDKPAKLIEYSIRTSDYDIKTNNIISALETYFNNNKKDLYKYGGSEIYKYFNNSKLILSECSIKEIWTREGGRQYYLLQHIVPVSVGVTFTPVPAEDVERFNILIDQQTLISKLSAKDFTYHLKSINGIKTDPANADEYLKALINGNWHGIKKSGKP